MQWRTTLAAMVTVALLVSGCSGGTPTPSQTAGGKGGPPPAPAISTGQPVPPGPNGQTKPSATRRAVPTVTPSPTATALPTPQVVGDSSTVPAELAGIPLPPGFSLVKGSALRMVRDGRFEEAEATWFGTGDLEALKGFFKEQLEAKGWDLADEDITSNTAAGEGDLSFGMEKDGGFYGLNINLHPQGDGVEIAIFMNAA